MREYDLIDGLKEEDFMNLRWNTNVHTVQRKTGEYKIFNNRGVCLGQLEKSDIGYKIVVDERDMNPCTQLGKEIKQLRKMSQMIINNQISEPKLEEGRILDFIPYIKHYRRYSYAA